MHRWAALAVLATGQFLVVLSTSIVNVALPAIRTGLGMNATGLSWVVNAYGLAFGLLLLLGGRAADLFGRRRMLVIGLAGFAITSLVAGSAPTAAVLIVARVVQGVSAAALAPAALSLVLTLFPSGRERGTALGVWGGVSGAGGAAGVLLSGVLTDVFGWQANFYIAVPLAVAAIVAAYVVIPADPPRATVAGPLVSTRIFAIRDVTVANVAMTLLGAAWVSLFYFLPLYQQQVLGYSPMKSGLTQLPLAIMIMVGSALAPRLPLRASLAIGLALLATGLAWFGQEPVDLIVPSLLTGAGLGIAFVHLTTLASRGVPAADTGLASGLINTTRQVGGAIGLAALTGLTTASAFIATAAIAAVAALFVSKGVQ